MADVSLTVRFFLVSRLLRISIVSSIWVLILIVVIFFGLGMFGCIRMWCLMHEFNSILPTDKTKRYSSPILLVITFY